MLGPLHISDDERAKLYACMHSKPPVSATPKLNKLKHTKLEVLTHRQAHRQNSTCGQTAEVSSLSYIEMLVDLVLQLVTHLFGITQQHLCVLFVKHWVVSTSVPSAHGALHHNYCLALPHLHHISSLSLCAGETVWLCVCSTEMSQVHTSMRMQEGFT